MWLSFLIKHLKLKRILDVGCGPADILDFLTKLEYDKYVGIDLSNTIIETARKRHSRHSGANFVCCHMYDFGEIPNELRPRSVNQKDPKAIIEEYHKYNNLVFDVIYFGGVSVFLENKDYLNFYLKKFEPKVIIAQHLSTQTKLWEYLLQNTKYKEILSDTIITTADTSRPDRRVVALKMR
jgi:SAM-dependent methyltransferase